MLLSDTEEVKNFIYHHCLFTEFHRSIRKGSKLFRGNSYNKTVGLKFATSLKRNSTADISMGNFQKFPHQTAAGWRSSLHELFLNQFVPRHFSRFLQKENLGPMKAFFQGRSVLA